MEKSGMITSMTMMTVKKAITLQTGVESEARKLAPGGNFSAFVNSALIAHIQRTKLAQLVSEDEEKRGPIDEVVLAKVHSELEG